MKFLVTGDTHGNVMSRLNNIDTEVNPPQDTAIIILGDVGVNFYLNKTDEKNKRAIQNSGFTIYCVRGNHEERPENIELISYYYDENVSGTVFREEKYPNIRYFLDGNSYTIEGHETLVIGGAYSVDKYYRINQFGPNARWNGWFKDEQLTQKEMQNISFRMSGRHYDFVLTHTCPYDWQPFDLFLGAIDQSTVDNTMEKWLNEFKETITWDAWLFGHFHDDRLVRPGVEMYFNDIDELEVIYDRWTSSNPLPWWLKKDPNYYFKGDKD